LPPSPELISLTAAEEGETTVEVAGRKVTTSAFDLPLSVTNTDLIFFYTSFLDYFGIFTFFYAPGKDQ
jgi:hypothetical protein